MSLTIPPLTGGTPQCVISLESIDRNININVNVTAAQVAAWSDQDLTDRVNALTAAVQSFLSPGETTRLNVSWQNYARTTIVRRDEVIDDPAATPAE
ncbi:hypothetical protein [Streptomyces sp. NPDC002403]